MEQLARRRLRAHTSDGHRAGADPFHGVRTQQPVGHDRRTAAPQKRIVKSGKPASIRGSGEYGESRQLDGPDLKTSRRLGIAIPRPWKIPPSPAAKSDPQEPKTESRPPALAQPPSSRACHQCVSN